MNNSKSLSTCHRKISKALLATSVSLLTTLSLSVSAVDYSKVEKELRIMDKIFETSLSESKSKSNRLYFGRNSRSTYLAQQGMVFSFDFNNSQFGSSADWQAFGEGIGNLVGTITNEVAAAFGDVGVTPPAAPVAPRSDGLFSNDGDVLEENLAAYEAYQEAMENLRESQRDQRQEVRDLQRAVRDIERQARHEENSKEVAKTKEKLKKKMKELAKKTKAYEESMKKYRAKRAEQLNLRNKEKSDSIIGTLCDYGSTLKSLKNNEHVTVIFNDYENNKDQVYVFDYKDVKNCSGKQSLLKKAISYQL